MRCGPAVALALGLGAPGPATGQVAGELGLHLTAATGRPAGVFAGPGASWRIGRRDRIAFTSGAGLSEHRAAARAEAMWHFLLAPRAERGIGAYFGGGVAGQVGRATRGWVVFTAGVESRPGAGRGWVLELGVGGGVRVSAGYRWRWKHKGPSVTPGP